MISKCDFFYLWLFLATVTFGLFWGCEEREVFSPDYGGELKQYLIDTEEGRELFRTAGLIAENPYTLPYDMAVYRDFVDSTWRSVDIPDSVYLYDFGIYGELPAVEVSVTDIFFVTTLRILETDNAPETTRIFSEREVNRYGYFVKQGDDSKPFLGWKLWAFNSLGRYEQPVNLSVKTADGVNTLAAALADYTYDAPGSSLLFVLLTDINNLSNGDTLVFNVSPRPDIPMDYFHLVTAETNSGFVTQTMDRIDDQNWVDTIVTPSPNPRLWNVIFVQSFLTPPSFQYIRGWCIPYRIPQ